MAKHPVYYNPIVDDYGRVRLFTVTYGDDEQEDEQTVVTATTAAAEAIGEDPHFGQHLPPAVVESEIKRRRSRNKTPDPIIMQVYKISDGHGRVRVFVLDLLGLRDEAKKIATHVTTVFSAFTKTQCSLAAMSLEDGLAAIGL